jgi:hypothetical protein
MKKLIYPILAFVVIFIIGCTNAKKAEVENPYVGAWEHMSSKFFIHYLDGQKPDTTYVTPAANPPAVKIFTKKHYAVGHQTENDGLAGGGGEYTYNGDSVTCIRRYSAAKGRIGIPVVWKSKINGDLWSFSRVIKNDTFQADLTETWKRIPE